MKLLFRSGTFDNEDFAITPYLTLIWPKKPDGYKFFGVGISFGWWSICACITFNEPKGVPMFARLKRKVKTD
jgi:hypothetical protein